MANYPAILPTLIAHWLVILSAWRQYRWWWQRIWCGGCWWGWCGCWWGWCGWWGCGRGVQHLHGACAEVTASGDLTCLPQPATNPPITHGQLVQSCTCYLTCSHSSRTYTFVSILCSRRGFWSARIAAISTPFASPSGSMRLGARGGQGVALWVCRSTGMRRDGAKRGSDVLFTSITRWVNRPPRLTATRLCQSKYARPHKHDQLHAHLLTH